MNLATRQKWEDDIKLYLSATKLFNYFLDDPLLDYLDRFGSEMGYQPSEIPEEIQYILDKGILFEEKIVDLIKQVIPMISIPERLDWVEGCSQTFQAMKAGYPIIYQGYLINPENRTKGKPDLLVRADYLNKFKPGLIADSELVSSHLGPWHYRVIDIKLSNINLTADGKYILNSKLYKTYKAQVLVYNLALGYLQGYQPPQAYLLGRGSHNYNNTLVNQDCFSSIASIDYQDYDHDFLIKLEKALEWHQTLNQMSLPKHKNADQYDWTSLDNQVSNLDIYLRPNMKNNYDYRWNSLKNQIANQTQDITLLWNCGPAKRDLGFQTWPEYLKQCQEKPGINNSILAQIIKTNLNQKIIHPDQLDREYLELLPPLGTPFLVLDFEVTSNLTDDFSQLPQIGGQEIIFLIGASLVIPIPGNPQYRYYPFLIDHLTKMSEFILLKKFIAWISDLEKSFGPITFYHWSKAEPLFFEKMVERQWDNLSEDERNLLAGIYFEDLLTIFRHQPITIKGAFDFGLKSVAKSMHQHGLIKTTWKDNDINGLAAMLRIVKYDREALERGLSLNQCSKAHSIVEYNLVDCQVLAEIILFLQEKYLKNQKTSEVDI